MWRRRMIPLAVGIALGLATPSPARAQAGGVPMLTREQRLAYLDRLETQVRYRRWP